MPQHDAPNRTPIGDSETDIRNGLPRTNERTNERRGSDRTCINPDSPERACAYNTPEGFASIGDVIDAGQLWRTETRHPRVRTGERDHQRAAAPPTLATPDESER